MSHYLFIESKDPFEVRGGEFYLGAALELCRQNESVTVYFVEDGSNAARRGAEIPHRDALRAAGASLRVDEFALRERGIGRDQLADGIAVGDADHIVDLLAQPETKGVWH